MMLPACAESNLALHCFSYINCTLVTQTLFSVFKKYKALWVDLDAKYNGKDSL